MVILLILINLNLDWTLCYDMKAKFLLDNNVSPVFNNTHRELARELAKDQFNQLKDLNLMFKSKTDNQIFLEGIDNVTDNGKYSPDRIFKNK